MRPFVLLALVFFVAEAHAQERLLLEAQVQVETEAIRITVVRPEINFGRIFPMSDLILDPSGARRGVPAEVRIEGAAGVSVEAFVETPYVILSNVRGDRIPLRVLLASTDCIGQGGSALALGTQADYSCRRLLVGGHLRVGRVSPGRYSGQVAVVISAM